MNREINPQVYARVGGILYLIRPRRRPQETTHGQGHDCLPGSVGLRPRTAKGGRAMSEVSTFRLYLPWPYVYAHYVKSPGDRSR